VIAHLPERFGVVFVDLRIRFAVAADVRQAIGLAGIGPEVAGEADVVVAIDARKRVPFVDHRVRPVVE
jgi:hypothetical protein